MMLRHSNHDIQTMLASTQLGLFLAGQESTARMSVHCASHSHRSQSNLAMCCSVTMLCKEGISYSVVVGMSKLDPQLTYRWSSAKERSSNMQCCSLAC